MKSVRDKLPHKLGFFGFYKELDLTLSYLSVAQPVRACLNKLSMVPVLNIQRGHNTLQRYNVREMEADSGLGDMGPSN